MAMAGAAGAAAGAVGTAVTARYLTGSVTEHFPAFAQQFEKGYQLNAEEQPSGPQIIDNIRRIGMLEAYIYFLHDKLSYIIGGENPFKGQEKRLAPFLMSLAAMNSAAALLSKKDDAPPADGQGPSVKV